MKVTKKKITELDKVMEEFTPEEKKIIRTQFFPPSATDMDMVYCMQVAKQLGLNPILKEIYFVERKQQINGKWITKIEPMLGRNSYLTIAHRSGKFDGMESGYKIAPVPKFINGTWQSVEELVGWARVYNKDMSHPICVEVPYSEYVQRKKDGSITSFWVKFPTTMIVKVAESQALRKAFNIRGALDFYEAVDEIDVETAEEVIENDTKNEDVGALLSKNNAQNIKASDVMKETEKATDDKVEQVKQESVQETEQDEEIIDIDQEPF